MKTDKQKPATTKQVKRLLAMNIDPTGMTIADAGRALNKYHGKTQPKRLCK